MAFLSEKLQLLGDENAPGVLISVAKKNVYLHVTNDATPASKTYIQENPSAVFEAIDDHLRTNTPAEGREYHSIRQPENKKREVPLTDLHNQILDKFDELKDTQKALLVYIKSRKTMLCSGEKDGKGSGKKKRAREDDQEAQPAAKARKASTKKVPVAEVRTLLDNMVSRFEVAIGALCKKIDCLECEKRSQQEALDDAKMLHELEQEMS